MGTAAVKTKPGFRRTDELWRAFLEAAPAGVVVLDRDMRYLAASERWKRDYHLEGREIIGRSHYEIFPEISERWREIHRRCIAGATESCEADPFPRADGRTDWVRWEIRPWHHSDGEIGGIVIFSEVITARIQAEQALKASEARYRALIEQAPEAILILDLESDRFIDANRNAELLFGCDRASLLKRGPQHFLAPEQPNGRPIEASFDEHRRQILAGKPVIFERLIRNAASAEVHCEVRLAPLPSAAGRLVRASLIDITRRKEAEDALRESEQRFSAVFHDSPAGTALIDLDDDNRIVDVNRAWLEMLGYEGEDLIGRATARSKIWVDPASQDAMYAAIGSPPGLWSSDIRMRRKDGAVVDVGMTLRRIEIGGRPFVIALGRDITERRRAERAIGRLNRTLRTLSSGNEALVRAKDEQHLLDEMCRIFVERGGYLAAAIRYAEHDTEKSLRLVAYAGADRERLGAENLVWADVPLGRGPTGTAIRTGKVQVRQDLVANSLPSSRQKILDELGVAAAIGLPLKSGPEMLGALTIYAGETNAFTPEEVGLLTELSNDLAFGIVALRDRKEREGHERRLRETLDTTIEALSRTVETRDSYTAGHQHRTAELATAIARELGLPNVQAEGIHIAGVLHDIGKISVPAEFLSKPTRLWPAEFDVVKMHVQTGYDIIKDIRFPWPIADIVLQHHERLDGSGYPNRLKGDAMLLEAKILAVADVAEAMMSHRPYRPALGLDAALQEIERGKGRLYDAAAVDACIALFRQRGFKLD